jgi:outer membrane protein insertion porin family
MKIKTILFLPLLLLTAFVPILAQTDEEVEENPVILYSGTPKRYEIADITVKGDDQNVQTLKNLSGLVVGQRIAVPGPEISNAMKRHNEKKSWSGKHMIMIKVY